MKSLRQVLSEVNEMETRTQMYLQSVGYKTELASRKYKKMIKICTSLGIVFLHFGMTRQALDVLNKALKIDVKMFFEGESEDRSWTGRILIYCNLAYLLTRCQDSQSALKFLYDSESLLLDMRGLNKPINDLRFSHSFLVFLTLVSIKKYENSEKYLSIAIQSFSVVTSRYDIPTCKNLYFLLEFSRVIISNYLEGVFISVKEAIRAVVSVEYPTDEVMGIIQKFRKSRVEKGVQLISGEVFAESVFLTVFFPFVAEFTPNIAVEELERARNGSKMMNRVDLLQVLTNGKKTAQDCYSVLMKIAIEQVRFKGYKY